MAFMLVKNNCLRVWYDKSSVRGVRGLDHGFRPFSKFRSFSMGFVCPSYASYTFNLLPCT